LFPIAVDGTKSDAFTILMMNASDLALSTAMTTKKCDVTDNSEEPMLFYMKESC
jgi:hypothetical protein